MKSSLYVLLIILVASCKAKPIEDSTSTVSNYRTYSIETLKQVSYTTRLIEGEFNQTFNELRFRQHHPNVLGEMSYLKYGRWDTLIPYRKKEPGILIWKNVAIGTIAENLNIATTSYEDAYSAIMIFDENGKDMLAEGSPLRTSLINYLIYEINTYDHSQETDFRDESWKGTNPKSYKRHHSKPYNTKNNP